MISFDHAPTSVSSFVVFGVFDPFSGLGESVNEFNAGGLLCDYLIYINKSDNIFN